MEDAVLSIAKPDIGVVKTILTKSRDGAPLAVTLAGEKLLTRRILIGGEPCRIPDTKTLARSIFDPQTTETRSRFEDDVLLVILTSH